MVEVMEWFSVTWSGIFLFMSKNCPVEWTAKSNDLTFQKSDIVSGIALYSVIWVSGFQIIIVLLKISLQANLDPIEVIPFSSTVTF